MDASGINVNAAKHDLHQSKAPSSHGGIAKK
jgi:hypothetical protein